MNLRALVQKFRAASPKRQMPGFDEGYYLRWYPDAVGFGDGALAHYLRHGWKEGRDPSAGFSTDGYLAVNADVKASGDNPLDHFLDHGLAEGRRGWEKDPKAPAPAPRYTPDSGEQKLLAPPRSN